MQSYRASTSISYDEPYYNRTLCCPGYGGTYCEGLEEFIINIHIAMQFYDELSNFAIDFWIAS